MTDTANHNDSLRRIREISDKIGAFREYKKRIEIIQEVITDQQLLAESPGWNLNFIVDFHQVHSIAFPPVVKAETTVEGGRIKVELTFPGKEEKSRIFRDRIRKAIPFFGLDRVKHYPVLIGPYREEMEISMNNQFGKLLRQKLQEYIFYKKKDIGELKNQWANIVAGLDKAPKPFSDEEKDDLRKKVEEFSQLTVESFYILSLLDSVRGARIIEFLLTDRDPRKGKRLRLEDDFEAAIQVPAITDDDFIPWLKRLNKYRFKTFSNIIDARAIAQVLKFNEIAAKEKRRDIYFLLSDAGGINFALGAPDNVRGRASHQKPSPRCRNPLLPAYCPPKGINILRTSFHFEEYMMAYDESLDVQIKNLQTRKERLIKNIEVISPQIAEMSDKCKKEPGNCPCDSQARCDELKEKISHFFKTEEEQVNLTSILEKKTILEPLLKFTRNFVNKPPVNKAPENKSKNKSNQNIELNEIAEIKELEEAYTNFFLEDYSAITSKKLTTILREYEDEYYRNINSIVQTISTADNSINATMNSLKKMEGIIYNIAFDTNEDIRNLINRVFSGKPEETETRLSLDSAWYREVYQAIHENKDSVEGTLLAILLLFCNESFEDSEWLATYWLENREKEIKNSNKLVEFNFIRYSAAAWNKYSPGSGKPSPGQDQSDRDMLSALTGLMETFPRDPRIPYLIGKLAGLKFQFSRGAERANGLLEESVIYSRKALAILDTLKEERDLRFEEIRVPLENNILWCKEFNGPKTPKNESPMSALKI